SANFAPYSVLTEPVLEEISRRFDVKDWTVPHTLQLTLAARMLAYDALARRHKYTYVPSSARAKIHRVDPGPKVLSVLDLAQEDTDTKNAEAADLPALISAI